MAGALTLMPGDSQQPMGMTPTARHTVARLINAVTAGASGENDLRQDLIDPVALQTRRRDHDGVIRVWVISVRPTLQNPSS
jgi:hypothetical protein